MVLAPQAGRVDHGLPMQKDHMKTVVKRMCQVARVACVPSGVLALVLLVLPGAAPLAQTREGVDVGGNSAFSKLVSAETVEQSAGQQYQKMMQEAAAKNALAPKDSPQVQRLRKIASKITGKIKISSSKMSRIILGIANPAQRWRIFPYISVRFFWAQAPRKHLWCCWKHLHKRRCQ